MPNIPQIAIEAVKEEQPKDPVMEEHLEFTLDWGVHALLKLITIHHREFSSILDVGGGSGEHTRFLRLFGKEAYSVDSHDPSADYKGDFLTFDFQRKFDAVFCSHVLEHQRNVGNFIEKMYDMLADGGILAIAVPVHPRERMVSGHITSWNAGLLIYNLVLGGFDCRDASFIQQADLNLVVQKKPAKGGDIHTAAAWDHVDSLAQYFPFSVTTGSNAEIMEINWTRSYSLPPIWRLATLRIKSRTVGELVLKMK